MQVGLGLGGLRHMLAAHLMLLHACKQSGGADSSALLAQTAFAGSQHKSLRVQGGCTLTCKAACQTGHFFAA